MYARWRSSRNIDNLCLPLFFFLSTSDLSARKNQPYQVWTKSGEHFIQISTKCWTTQVENKNQAACIRTTNEFWKWYKYIEFNFVVFYSAAVDSYRCAPKIYSNQIEFLVDRSLSCRALLWVYWYESSKSELSSMHKQINLSHSIPSGSLTKKCRIARIFGIENEESWISIAGHKSFTHKSMPNLAKILYS